MSEYIYLAIKNIYSITKIDYKSVINDSEIIDSWFSSLKIIIKWFTNDYIKTDYNIEQVLSNHKIINRNIERLEIVIHIFGERGWKIDEIINECVKLHYETIDNLTPDILELQKMENFV